jgi:glutamate-1-semialdehyde aminotransferase
MGLYLAREEFEAPTNFAESKVLCENGLYKEFFHAMLRRGVALAPGAYEILFVSLAHTETTSNARSPSPPRPPRRLRELATER